MERFGIPLEKLQRYSFWERGRKVWAFSGELWEIKNIEALGIKALTRGRDLKPSTAFLRIVGEYATRNVVHLPEDEALLFLKGEDVKIDAPVEHGYVIVRCHADILGCGFYRKEEKRLQSLVPAKYRLQGSWV